MMHFDCSYGLLNDFVSLGGIAMTGFFLLSGYSLYLAYSKKDLFDLSEIKSFYLKRSISILPLYFFIALVCAVYGVSSGGSTLKDEAVLFPVEALCLQSTFSSLDSFSHNGGTWFISCLVICYILYPFLQSLFQQMTNKTRIMLIIIMVGVLLYAPIIQILYKQNTIYANPFYRLLEFSIGVLVAKVNSTSGSKFFSLLRTRFSVLLFTFALLLSVSAAHRMGLKGYYMLASWAALPCFIGLLIGLGRLELNSLQNNKFVRYLSAISFPFFLCQVLPLWKLSQFTCSYLNNYDNTVKIIVSFTYCLVGAILIHEIVEKPVARYLRFKLL